MAKNILKHNIPLDGNFRAAVEYSYDTYHACQKGSDCCDGDSCRCGKVINERVISVNINKMIDCLCCGRKPKLSLFDKYIVDRVIRINKLYDVNKWKVSISNGYYGQDVDGAAIITPGNTSEDIKRILELPTIKSKLQEVLKLEYSFSRILPEKWNEYKIRYDDTEMANENHFTKISDEEWYKDYPFYHAIAVKLPNNRFKIIDGHHRVKANMDKKLKVLACDFADY